MVFFIQSKAALHPPRFWLPFTIALNFGLFFSSSPLLNTTWLEIPGVLKIKERVIDNRLELMNDVRSNLEQIWKLLSVDPEKGGVGSGWSKFEFSRNHYDPNNERIFFKYFTNISFLLDTLNIIYFNLWKK